MTRPKSDYQEENAEFKREIQVFREENAGLSSQVAELTRQIEELYAAGASSESNCNGYVQQDPSRGGGQSRHENDEGFLVDPTKEAFLSDMGFNREKVFSALLEHNNNQEKALEMLFGG